MSFGWLITLASAALKIWGWITGREKQREGALKQEEADAKATQKAETDAARAANRADVDSAYARRVRDRYTYRGD